MKTNLNRTITNQEEAEAFLSELFENGESFHPEDDAHQIIWSCEQPPTAEECDKLNVLMNDCINVGDGEFDVCKYLEDLRMEEERRMNLARPNEGY